MQRNLTYGCKTIVCSTGATAGTSEVDGSAVDCLGFESARFIALLGTLTATQVTNLKVQGSNTNSGSDWTDLASSHAGPAADGDGGKTLITDIFRPQYRYLRPVVTRGTANAVISSILGELYVANFEPVTQDTSVSAFTVIAYAAAGTA